MLFETPIGPFKSIKLMSTRVQRNVLNCNNLFTNKNP